MKGVKLKPIFLPNDDIMVQPPNVLSTSRENDSREDKKRYTTSTIEQLKDLLRGRKLRKLDTKQIKAQEEQAQVEILSDWKIHRSPLRSPKSPRSPTKRFTFKFQTPDQTSHSTRIEPIHSLLNHSSKFDEITSAIQSVLHLERNRKREEENERKRFQEANKLFEEATHAEMARIKKEIENSVLAIHDWKKQVEETKQKIKDLEVKYENDVVEYHQQEAEEFLFNKVKGEPLGSENERFIRKEKIRQKKQALYVNFHKQHDDLVYTLEKNQKMLENSQELRKNLKKELKKAKARLINVYCRILKDGSDIRSEGLRWVIKALWSMNEPVPVSAFPKFLDDESAHFLLSMAQKDIELKEFQARLDRLKDEIKQKQLNGSFTRTPRDILETVKLRIKKLSTSREGKPIHLNKSMRVSEKDTDFAPETENISIHSEITWVRENISRIIDVMNNMIEKEILRVSRQIKPTENIKEPGLLHIIKCLVGDKAREFQKLTQRTASQGRNRVALAPITN
ncbi:unnamed protein product [Blepharisma stoltei]|uniref:Uncharacterized protein n=1 Tax=Blepharisma stoltei TaxID=1481888 RepID=A0AAU9IZ97_9CILI|nr:unnamed protein product [Blepharisma stoltei]